MKRIWRYLLAGSLILICAAAGWWLAIPPPDYPTLTVDGQPLPNACLPEQRARWKDASPRDAWPLLDTMLCESYSDERVAFLESRLLPAAVADYISIEPDASAVYRNELRRLSDEMMKEGAAWKPNITRDEAGFVLSYQADEACLHFRKLDLIEGKWMVSMIGDACY